MKTTLNPFENAKRTANGTGGFSPSVIEKMQAEISVLGSENASQAQDITDINAKLSVTDVSSGFCFDTTTVKDAMLKAYRWGNIITVYAIYKPIGNIPENTPFLFSQTYDAASPLIGTGSAGSYWIGHVTHKIDVRPIGTRTKDMAYYLYFTFITTTA